MATHVQANRDLPLSFVLRWLIVAAATCVMLSLLAGRRSGAAHPAVVTVEPTPFSAATALADVAGLPVVAA